MTFEQCETFLEVARQKSYRLAAEAENRTVSEICQMLEQLEAEFGAVLLMRGEGGLILTQEGKALLPDIQGIADAQGSLYKKACSIWEKRENAVGLGGLRAACGLWFADIRETARRAYPDILVRLVPTRYKTLRQDLENGVIDLAFAGDPDCEDLDFHFIREEPYVAVMPKGHALAGHTGVMLKDLGRESVILSEWSFDQAYQKRLYDNSLKHQIRYLIRDVETIPQMVECDMGIALLPKLMLGQHTMHMAVIPVENLPPMRLGVVMTPEAGQRPAVRQLLACIPGCDQPGRL